MIRVYRSRDGVARYITFDDADVPPAARLELVRAFRDDEREAAWHFLWPIPEAAPSRSPPALPDLLTACSSVSTREATAS